MSKILDLAKTFKATSSSEAESIRQELRDDFAKLENDIRQALSDASENLQDDIDASQRRWSMSLFRSWLIALIVLVLTLGVLIGAIAWKGMDLTTVNSQINRARQSLELLKNEGQRITLSRCNVGTDTAQDLRLCAVIDPAYQGKTWGGDKTPYVILMEK